MKKEKFITLTIVLAAAAAIAFAGCSAFKTGASKDGFNHKIHIEGAGLTCDSCHPTTKISDKAGMPGADACISCHAGEKEGTLDANAGRFFGADGKPSWADHGMGGDVIFSHQRHGEGGLDCDACHNGIKTSTSDADQLVPDMDDCMSCHSEAKGDAGCSLCHTKIRMDAPPENHLKNWGVQHGILARTGGETALDEARCFACHSENSCVECHQKEEPKDHTESWRYVGHTVNARMDRSRCETCHTADFCYKCHETTSPRTHIAGWDNGPTYRHCAFCHIPVQEEQTCFVCHKYARHDSAPERPNTPFHTTGADCLTCHNPQPHPNYANESCETCHPLD